MLLLRHQWPNNLIESDAMRWRGSSAPLGRPYEIVQIIKIQKKIVLPTLACDINVITMI